jgi:hypothetical protein
MMSFCSKIQLVCPVDGCNTAVPYLHFEEHKKRCIELSMQKMSLENNAELSAKNEALTRELEESKKRNKEQKKEIASLKAKISCKDEKIATMEKMYNDQKEFLSVIRKNHQELSEKKIELEERFSQVMKENYEYEKEARKTRNESDAEISARNETLTRELEESKLKNEESKKKIKEQKKQIVSLEGKVRCNVDKTLAIEKMYQKVKIQVDDLSKRKSHSDNCFRAIKKRHVEYKFNAERKLDEQEEIIESHNNEIAKMKEYICAALRENKTLTEDNEKCKKLLEQKIRENFKFQSQCKEQA